MKTLADILDSGDAKLASHAVFQAVIDDPKFSKEAKESVPRPMREGDSAGMTRGLLYWVGTLSLAERVRLKLTVITQ